MRRDFEISQGIYLVQSPHELDLHNHFEFRFRPRDSAMPFTEDDCVSSFGYWTDEDWAHGVIVAEPSQRPDPKWLTAVDFMSGAVIAVQAASAHARITG